MAYSESDNKKLFIQFDTKKLTPKHVRLLKSLNYLLQELLTTDQEDEYFDNSAEFMRVAASLIKQANFTENIVSEEEMPYASQVLEYSLDVLQEYMDSAKVVTYDN